MGIDDFGTGYSALSQLDALPADAVELDARFVSRVATSARRRAVPSGFLGICADLGLLVVAEGVEDAQRAQLVAALGCQLAQGYHFPPPGDADTLADHSTGPAGRRRRCWRARRCARSAAARR